MSAQDRRRARRRGISLCEAVLACAFATTLCATIGAEILRQRLELTTARGEARARGALAASYDRLRAGKLELPAPGAPPLVLHERGLEIAVVRTSLAAGSRLEAPGLVPVVLRATWREQDGKARTRELTTVVRAPGKEERK